jgi:hypothetical protein
VIKYSWLPIVIAACCADYANAEQTSGYVSCDYSDKTTVKIVGNIDAIRNYEHKVADYAEEKRICAVSFDAKIGENWVKTKNFYVFGPNMSQNEACNKAKDKAKVSALQENAPQVINNEVEHICDENITNGNVVTKQQIKTMPSNHKLVNGGPDVFYHPNGNCYTRDTAVYPHCHLFNSNSVGMNKKKGFSILEIFTLGLSVSGSF